MNTVQKYDYYLITYSWS